MKWLDRLCGYIPEEDRPAPMAPDLERIGKVIDYENRLRSYDEIEQMIDELPIGTKKEMDRAAVKVTRHLMKYKDTYKNGDMPDSKRWIALSKRLLDSMDFPY